MQNRTLQNENRLLGLLAARPCTAEELQSRLDLSQPTVSRLLTRNRARIAMTEKARPVLYAALRDVRGLGSEFPLFKIDPEGNARRMGLLTAVTQEGYFWNPEGAAGEYFRGLPWFIDDLRPDGFVGRAFVRRLHEALALPARGVDWNDDHVLSALARRGEDCMGNLVVGEESLERYFRMVRNPPAPIPSEVRGERYLKLAQAAMDGQPVGSSAGGEQPKFTALVEWEGAVANVLVKFSPSLETAAGRRWADLLICEHHALGVVAEQGISSSASRIVETGDRVFLEVERFDRVGLFGRRPSISLRAVDNEFYGRQDSWIAAAERLRGDRRLSEEDSGALRWLWVFGDLIANTDKHFGNISLIMTDGRRAFGLAPCYDMLPMLYRPREADVVTPSFEPPPVSAGAPQEWDSALAAALLFWKRAAWDSRISPAFREICESNRQAVAALASGPRLVSP